MRSLLPLLLLAASAAAQSLPLPEMANVAPGVSCGQTSTITAITAPSVVLQFGTGSTWSKTQTVTTAMLPFTIVYTDPAWGGDPAPGLSKAAVFQEQAAAVTVSCKDPDGAVAALLVPGLTGSSAGTYPAACSAPLAINANPVLPSSPLVCPALPNLVKVASNGVTVNELFVATEVVMQYCQTGSPAGGGHCSLPFIFIHLPIAVATTTPALGGDPGVPEELDVQQSTRQTIVQYADSAGVNHQVIVPPLS